MPASADSSRALLDAAYFQLGYTEGSLLAASETPDDRTGEAWIDKGDWLSLAKKVGAEKVFFVNEHPVIVFAEQTSRDPAAWMYHFNSVWCMARPQMLFLAREGELSVLNLTKAPARAGEDRDRGGRLLETVAAAAEVQLRLARFRRDQVESGRLFEEERFGLDDRADRALIRDLGTVRTALIKDGLSPGHAHALIGRSIFVRYLEDRKVLTEEYFRKVVSRARKELRSRWSAALDADSAAAAAAGSGHQIYYPRVLKSKLFTYALFKELSADFNGDIFPVNDEEELAVTEQHLNLLRRFLLGEIEESLFFFAYRFDIIPIELISSIYEKFYSFQPHQRRDHGSYYTPAALVDFLLSQTLTDDLLDREPSVLDPACGSGIFLVESFRRIVRHHWRKNRGAKLRAEKLRHILCNQIRGIDINREAIRVAAFSLYLAMLHYLEPPDILQHKLPSLTYTTRKRRNSEQHFDILLVCDAFKVEASLEGHAARARFARGAADVVVGNPPWGSPKGDDELASDGGVAWCSARGLSIGDKERSQSFVHRTMDFLAEGGRAGLLLSTGIFFKRHDKTRVFREQWLTTSTLQNVVNFAAVRDAFFQTDSTTREEGKGAIAPFAAVVFDKIRPNEANSFAYWSARETAFVRRIQAVILNRADLRRAEQLRFVRDDALWKIYWWGTHRDEALIQRLRLEKTLAQEFNPTGQNFRIGFLEAKKNQQASGWLRKFLELPTSAFERYGQLPTARMVKPPAKVKRRCEKEIYQGPRLLIKRGVGSDGIVARFETLDFSFRHSIYCITVPPDREADAKIALGIIWSSLTQYYLFMTSGSWGLWHDEVLKGTYATIPLRLPQEGHLKTRIIKIVDQLRTIPAQAADGPLFQKVDSNHSRAATIQQLEQSLNEAVFDLFELSRDERERVLELCTIGLDLFYKGMDSSAVKPVQWPNSSVRFGRVADLETTGEMSSYLRTFFDSWEPRLRAQAGKLRWRVIMPPGEAPVMAAIFETETEDDPLPDPDETEETAWTGLIQRLREDSRHPYFSKRVYVDGFIRVVTDSDIVILKRNERRLWTAATASEDAEATMLLAMLNSRSAAHA